MKRKICCVITARASYSRIRSALDAIALRPELELQIVAAASALLDRYGNAVSQIEQDGFKIDRRVYMIVEGENLVTSAKSTGLGLTELATVLDDLKPDAVITIADRYETIATSIAAAYMNIPLVHIQGGEITGSIDEKVRHANTKLADIHLVSSAHARDRILKMGEHPDRIFVTGCPSIDLARKAMAFPAPVIDPFERYGGVGKKFDLSGGYLVVLQHPVATEYEQSRQQIEETLHAVADLGLPTLWFWPNVDAGSDGTSKGIRSFREQNALPNVHFFKNVPPEEFIRLLDKSLCIVGNSSVAIRECAWLGVPAVNIGSRQSGRDRGGNVIDADYDRRAIARAVRTQLGKPRPETDAMYGAGSAGDQIAEILATVHLTYQKKLAY